MCNRCSKQEKRLNSFHLRCLRKILNIKWQDKVPNTEVLKKSHIHSIQTTLRERRLRWLGHIKRMDDHRLPKQVLYGELKEGSRSRGRPKLRFKDLCKSSLKDFGLPENEWEKSAKDRTIWRGNLARGAQRYEQAQHLKQDQKRNDRKLRSQTVTSQQCVPCSYCQRPCRSNIGRISHERSCSRLQS